MNTLTHYDNLFILISYNEAAVLGVVASHIHRENDCFIDEDTSLKIVSVAKQNYGHLSPRIKDPESSHGQCDGPHI